MNLYRSCLLGIISTHTLTWSVTGACIVRDVNPTDFNSHAHVERDVGRYVDFSEVENFNSHAHVERDRWRDS